MGKGVVLSALFAALISASFFIQIPIGGIPIVIQDMMSMLSGLMLGPLYGTLAVLIYLALGCLGLPVFSGKGGIQHLVAGPTAGFLVFYALGALFAGLLLKLLLPAHQEHSRAKSLIVITIAAILTTAVVFAGGIAGFMIVTGSELHAALVATLFPFIPGNVIKIALMVPLTYKFRPVIARYLRS